MLHNLPDIVNKIWTRRLCCTGHVEKKDNNATGKKIYYFLVEIVREDKWVGLVRKKSREILLKDLQ